MKMELPSKLEGLVKLKPDLLSFSGSREMLQFTVEDWRMTETGEGLEVSCEKFTVKFDVCLD